MLRSSHGRCFPTRAKVCACVFIETLFYKRLCDSLGDEANVYSSCWISVASSRFAVCKSICGSSNWDGENQSGITMQRAVSQRLLRAESCLHALLCWSSVVEEFRRMACIVSRSHFPHNLSALSVDDQCRVTASV